MYGSSFLGAKLIKLINVLFAARSVRSVASIAAGHEAPFDLNGAHHKAPALYMFLAREGNRPDLTYGCLISRNVFDPRNLSKQRLGQMTYFQASDLKKILLRPRLVHSKTKLPVLNVLHAAQSLCEKKL